MPVETRKIEAQEAAETAELVLRCCARAQAGTRSACASRSACVGAKVPPNVDEDAVSRSVPHCAAVQSTASAMPLFIYACETSVSSKLISRPIRSLALRMCCSIA